MLKYGPSPTALLAATRTTTGAAPVTVVPIRPSGQLNLTPGE